VRVAMAGLLVEAMLIHSCRSDTKVVNPQEVAVFLRD
jgi:hypothetical protein